MGELGGVIAWITVTAINILMVAVSMNTFEDVRLSDPEALLLLTGAYGFAIMCKLDEIAHKLGRRE